MDTLLTEAWNFLALTEEEEDRIYEETHGYEDED